MRSQPQFHAATREECVTNIMDYDNYSHIIWMKNSTKNKRNEKGRF